MSNQKKLVAEEQLLLKDIFLIKIYKDSLDQYNSELTFLPNFAKDLEYLPSDNVSLLQNTTLFDSLLMERLAIPNTKIFDYLFESYLRAKDQKNKSWNLENPTAQAFIDYSIQILQNFAHLFCSSPEVFPEKYPEPRFDEISDPVAHTGERIAALIENGIEEEFIGGLIAKFEKDEQEKLSAQILTSILNDHRHRTLSEDRTVKNAQNIYKLLTIDLFKNTFFNLKNYPWIPGPSGINLTKGVGSAMGNLTETTSPLGILLRPSFLQPLIETPKDASNYYALVEKIVSDIKKPMKRSAFEQIMKNYQGLHNEYCAIITDIFKLLLKPSKGSPIDYKDEVMRWFSAFLVGNDSRTKLGLRLEKQNKALKYASSDAMCLNVFDVMLEICSKFNSRTSNLLEKIDPTYYQYGWRFDYKETGMVNKPGVEVEPPSMESKKPSDYGTVTEFFFHCLELAHYCLIPILQNTIETIQTLNRLTEQKNAMPSNHPQFPLLEKEITRLENLYLVYKTIIFDEHRIKSVTALYDTLLHLLLKWNGIDVEKINSPNLSHIKPKAFMKYLPEHWLTDLFEFHFTYLRLKEDYGKVIMNYPGNYVQNLLTFVCVVLCESELISNPYTKAKLVELLSFFAHDASEMALIFDNNDLAKKVLTPTLIKFYIDIEFTGASHQFYSKYEYRHYASRIFKIIWKLDAYRNAFLDISKSELVERFTNMIMNDNTYCMDEGLANLDKLINLQNKTAAGEALTPEEEKSQEQFEGIARSVFLQVREGLDLMAQISTWAPHAFFFGDFRKRTAQLLNYFLVQVMNPKYFQLKTRNNDKLNFKPSRFIKDLIRIYANLAFDDEFCKEVTKDERSYNEEELRKAVKKARQDKDKPLEEEIIEKFEEFITKTQNISIENQDITAKLGDIPDEFICPISCDLMKEPVLLPTSNIIMEKSTIKQILLNDEHDPFNRAPLKFSQVKDLPELKKKIEDWVQRKLKGEIIDEEKGPKQEKKDSIVEEKNEDEELTTKDLFYQKKF